MVLIESLLLEAIISVFKNFWFNFYLEVSSNRSYSIYGGYGKLRALSTVEKVKWLELEENYTYFAQEQELPPIFYYRKFKIWIIK